MVTNTRKITADEFWEMPGESHRYELVDGELVDIGRTPKRGRMTGEISALLLNHVTQYRLPLFVGVATGFQIDAYNLRFPDVHVTSCARMAAYDETKGPWPHFIPDIAVEVLSFNDTLARLSRKTEDYFAYGAQAMWIADPNQRTVTVRRPGTVEQIFWPDDILSGEREIPGFSCAVADIFAVLDRPGSPAPEDT